MTTKEMRASMDEEEFHRFKRMKGQFGKTTNDGALVALMDSHESDPSVDECIKVLEDNGYQVVEEDD